MPADTFTVGDRVRMVEPGGCLEYQVRVGHLATVRTREADDQPDLVPIEFDDGELMRVYPRRLQKVITPAVGDVCIVTTHTIDGRAPGQPPIPDGAEVTVRGLPHSGGRLVGVIYADADRGFRYRTIDIHQLTKKENHMTVTTETQVSTYQPGDQAVVMRDVHSAFTPGTIVTVTDGPTFRDGVSVSVPGVTDSHSVSERALRPIRDASDIPNTDRQGTLDERLGHAQVGDSVYITGYVLRPHGDALTNPVTVLSVDRADAYQTFKVQHGQDEGAGIWWVYDVEKVESPEVETRVSDLAVGDRAKVTSPHLYMGNRSPSHDPIPVGAEVTIGRIEVMGSSRPVATVTWDGNDHRQIDLACLTKVETPPQEPTTERDALVAENARLRAELSAELARQEAWFEEVAQIANSERDNNNWCRVYQSTMKDMGLGHLLSQETYTVTLTVTTPPGIEESIHDIESRILRSLEGGPDCSHDDENCTIRVTDVERTD